MVIRGTSRNSQGNHAFARAANYFKERMPGRLAHDNLPNNLTSLPRAPSYGGALYQQKGYRVLRVKDVLHGRTPPVLLVAVR